MKAQPDNAAPFVLVLVDEPAPEVEPPVDYPAEPPATTVGELMNADRLCTACRWRLADGELDGEPLCLHCVEPVLERWVALEADPWLPLPELADDPWWTS